MLTITYGSILAVFFTATPPERLGGARFYSDAHTLAQSIAANGVSVETVAGVIAALSPNNRWSRNVADAGALVAAFAMGGYGDAAQVKVGTYNANKIKALRILNNEPPLDVLGGLKVRAFYRCIMGDHDAVCVDGHAYSVWRGERFATSLMPKISPKLYSAIAADYARATEQVNDILGESYSPSQVQAITWLVWRRLTAGMREARK